MVQLLKPWVGGEGCDVAIYSLVVGASSAYNFKPPSSTLCIMSHLSRAPAQTQHGTFLTPTSFSATRYVSEDAVVVKH